MEFFKIFLVKSPKVDKISTQLSRLCSESPKIIEFDNKTHLVVKYNPDVYFSNLDAISKFFTKGNVIPLLMTNFKFLYLLKESPNYDLIINGFELSGGDDEEFQDLIFQHFDKLDLLKEFLHYNCQKISYFEFRHKDNRNYIRIYQTGVISITEGFEDTQEKNTLLGEIVGLLIEGNLI